MIAFTASSKRLSRHKSFSGRSEGRDHPGRGQRAEGRAAQHTGVEVGCALISSMSLEKGCGKRREWEEGGLDTFLSLYK